MAAPVSEDIGTKPATSSSGAIDGAEWARIKAVAVAKQIHEVDRWDAIKAQMDEIIKTDPIPQFQTHNSLSRTSVEYIAESMKEFDKTNEMLRNQLVIEKKLRYTPVEISRFYRDFNKFYGSIRSIFLRDQEMLERHKADLDQWKVRHPDIIKSIDETEFPGSIYYKR